MKIVRFLIIIIHDVKNDLIMCEPHRVKIFFADLTSLAICLFNI